MAFILNARSAFNTGCSIFFALTAFFVSLLPLDFLFAWVGGRDVKLLVWGGMLLVSLILVLFKLHLSSGREIRDSRIMFFCLIPPLYYLLANQISPPEFNYNQLYNLVIFAPLFCLMGVLSVSKVVVLFLLAASVLYQIMFLYGVYLGNILLGMSEFQTLLPGEVYDAGVGSYQNSTLFLALFSAILLSLSDSVRAIKARIAIYISFVASLIPVFIMGGRSAAFALVVAILCFFLFRTRSLGGRKLVWSILFGSILVSGVYLLMPIFKDSLVVSRTVYLTDAVDGSDRIYLFSSAIRFWLQDVKSFVFGIGPQQFPVSIGLYHPGAYPHNFILELLCEYGLLGCLIFCIPVFGVLSVIFRKNRDAASLVIITMFMTVSMGTGSLQSIWQLVYIVFSFYRQEAKTPQSLIPLFKTPHTLN